MSHLIDEKGNTFELRESDVLFNGTHRLPLWVWNKIKEGIESNNSRIAQGENIALDRRATSSTHVLSAPIEPLDPYQQVAREWQLQTHIAELEHGIVKYCGRPTKDGAKNLLSLVRNYDQARDALARVLREEEE